MMNWFRAKLQYKLDHKQYILNLSSNSPNNSRIQNREFKLARIIIKNLAYSIADILIQSIINSIQLYYSKNQNLNLARRLNFW